MNSPPPKAKSDNGEGDEVVAEAEPVEALPDTGAGDAEPDPVTTKLLASSTSTSSQEGKSAFATLDSLSLNNIGGSKRDGDDDADTSSKRDGLADEWLPPQEDPPVQQQYPHYSEGTKDKMYCFLSYCQYVAWYRICGSCRLRHNTGIVRANARHSSVLLLRRPRSTTTAVSRWVPFLLLRLVSGAYSTNYYYCLLCCCLALSV